jgi:hypothetical protein
MGTARHIGIDLHYDPVRYGDNTFDLQPLLALETQGLQIPLAGILGFYRVFAFIPIWSPTCTALVWRKGEK